MSIKRALISVSNKSGIIEFAQNLASLNIEILSTGGTAKLLREHNIPVIEVSDYTGYPEMMAGRVKTLNPKIHGGILARRGVDEKVMSENKIVLSISSLLIYTHSKKLSQDLIVVSKRQLKTLT